MRDQSPEAGDLDARRQTLAARGVVMLDAPTVFLDDFLDPARIAPGVVIHPGCRLRGGATSIGPGCVLGEEAPVTVENCQLERDVRLKGGFFSGVTLLAGAEFGSGAHVRPGTLLEEQSSCAHTVGLKQTVLMPHVVLGSLINFCDCFMAGGTDRARHSEVGSSFVHFNFTPHGDKATPSLFGDVPRGVMLDQPPIFLGGQGGVVGPVAIEYGTILAAGTVWWRDVTEGGRLVFGPSARAAGRIEYDPAIYGDVRKLLARNLIYIGNLHALHQWYRHVRSGFLARDPWGRACLDGALGRMKEMVTERVKRLAELADKLRLSVAAAERKHRGSLPEQAYALQKALAERWPAIAPKLAPDAPAEGDRAQRDRFLAALDGVAAGTAYLAAIRGLDRDARKAGTAWLQSVVSAIAAPALDDAASADGSGRG